jgi:transposase
MTYFVGIDISKNTLDWADTEKRSGTVLNNEMGIKQLKQRFQKSPPERIVLEATGGFEKDVLLALFEANLPVVQVNPRQVRDFAKALGRLAKTDALDAEVLALFAQAVKPPVRSPHNDNALAAIVSRRSQVVKMRTEEKNRLKQCTHADTKTRILQHLDWLNAEIKDLDQQMNKALDSEPLAEKIQALPGVGTVLTATLLADCPELGTLNRKEIASLVGLAPFNRDSGGMRGKRCIWGGRASIRVALYMPTVSSIKHYAPLKAFFERLTAAGKPFKVAITACMRKLLTILNAIAKQHLHTT